jgi:hypothetical protein
MEVSVTYWCVSSPNWFSNASRNSFVGIEAGYVLDDKGVEFSIFYIVQTGSGAHPTSYPMCTRELHPRG